MHGFDVLVRIERAVDERLGDARGQRPQHEDARDARIGVELPDHGEDVGHLGVVGQVLVRVLASEAFGQPPDVPLVRSGGRIVSDEDGGESRPGAGDLQQPELLVHVLREFLGQLVAVDHGSRHPSSFRR